MARIHHWTRTDGKSKATVSRQAEQVNGQSNTGRRGRTTEAEGRKSPDEAKAEMQSTEIRTEKSTEILPKPPTERTTEKLTGRSLKLYSDRHLSRICQLP